VVDFAFRFEPALSAINIMYKEMISDTRAETVPALAFLFTVLHGTYIDRHKGCINIINVTYGLHSKIPPLTIPYHIFPYAVNIITFIFGWAVLKLT
jgi:hypothetical protein